MCRCGTRVAAPSEVGNRVDVLRLANIRNAKGLDTFGYLKYEQNILIDNFFCH